MENLSFMVMTAVIVVGVLQICLFFKVWGMCNNVVKIRRSVAVNDGQNYYWTIRKLLAKGEIDKAEDIILTDFFKHVEEMAYSVDDAVYSNQKRWLIIQYQAIGREVPEAIAKAQTLHDLKQIFNPTYKV